MELSYELVPDWPPLAWIARCDTYTKRVNVQHGRSVECTQSWFCEAVWPGDFAKGNFDTHELVFGSGGRVRGGVLRFVSSVATVDRLHVHDSNGSLRVSNSLPCLLEDLEAEVDTMYRGYYEDFRSIVKGIKRYKTNLETTAGPIYFCYYYNVFWDGENWWMQEKKKSVISFLNFAEYTGFLRNELRKIGDNMSSSDRELRYKPLGTLSTGYDSPAVACLAREAGVEEAVTFTHARGGEGDNGARIGGYLGLSVTEVSRDAWKRIDNAIVPHMASNAYGEEVPYAGLSDQLDGRVLFTGHTGDRAWGMRPDEDLSADILRGDPVGLSLSEARLWYGTIHCPVPFMGIRQIRDLRRISTSSEMTPWRVPGEYSRPIPRRIVEEAGVPRDIFGQEKRASAVVLWRRDDVSLPRRDLEDLRVWLITNEQEWTRRGLTSPLRKKRRERVIGTLMMGYRPVHSVACRIPGMKAHSDRLRKRFDPYTNTDPLFEVMFPWAIEKAKKRYRKRARHYDEGSAAEFVADDDV